MVTPAIASLIALVAAILLSCTTQLNVGLIGMALAWLIGVFVAGWSAEEVAAGFPTQLFLTLAGVTLLFTVSEVNGTLDLVGRRAMRLARGSRALVPVVVFLIAMIVSTIGPGAVAATALVAPLAMALGARSSIPPFLSALMVANGANAGNLSPLSSVGVIANAKMASIGLGGHEWKVWAANFLAHAAVAAAAWLLFGGLKLVKTPGGADGPSDHVARLGGRQWLTIAAIAAWVAGVVVFKLNLGFSAFAAAIVLIVFRAADESASIKRMPWNAILMISGISLLIGVLEKSGGMDLFTGLLARLASPGTINGFIALVTGAISTYSSTSGVVLPTFLPTVPTLVAKVGGGDPLAVALSINVGASMVDVSPLSTIGALCVAAVTDTATSRVLFRKMLIWGLSMTLVGAVLCQWLAGAFARM